MGIFNNCNFTKNSASTGGGAISAKNTFQISNSIFKYNNGTLGGALKLDCNNANISNCTFNNNNAQRGGAIYSNRNYEVNLCNFTNNSAEYGSAIYLDSTATGQILNSYFKDNKAKSNNIMGTSKYNLTLTFAGNDNYINAIYANNVYVSFNNVDYWNGAMVNTNTITPDKSIQEAGQNLTIEIYNSTGQLIDNITTTTNTGGQTTYNYNKLPAGEYTYRAYHPDNTYYTYLLTTGSFNINKYNITVLSNETKSSYKNRETPINATIKDSNGQNIQLPADTKLVFILRK